MGGNLISDVISIDTFVIPTYDIACILWIQMCLLANLLWIHAISIADSGILAFFARRTWKSLTTTSYKVSQSSNKIGSISPGMCDSDPPPALEPLAQAIFAFLTLGLLLALNNETRSLEDALHQSSLAAIVITKR